MDSLERKHSDLDAFEVWCIDFLRSIKRFREQTVWEQDRSFTREIGIESGNNMLAKIPDLVKELEQQE